MAPAPSFSRVTAGYSESILAGRAGLALANIALTRNQAEQARRNALAALDMPGQAGIQAPARLILARAYVALGQPHEAYDQLQEIRHNYPHGAADAAARALEKSLLRTNPEVADTASLSYLTQEAQLSLTEGQTGDAYSAAPSGRWRWNRRQRFAPRCYGCRPNHPAAQPDRQERAFKSYLALGGPKAPDALFDLARVYWHRKDTAGAREYFRQLVARFPGSGLAAGAMLRIGRTYEDEGRFDQARSAYLQLVAARPHSQPAADARFRSVWLLYRHHRFSEAASGFEAMKPRAADASERAMYEYWNARSLEQAGQDDRARQIFSDLAYSTVTNYYPAMAGRRVGEPRIDLPGGGAGPARHAVVSWPDARRSICNASWR